MRSSTTSANSGASQPKKDKAACDQCNASKVKCPGGAPPCKRCADRSQPCHYSLARRIGKPPGSKNRKTLEKLRQAKDVNLENDGGSGGGDSSIPQNDGGRNDGDGALNVESERREGDDSHDPLQASGTTSFRPLSPLINYPSFPDPSQFTLTPEPDFLDGDHGVCFDGGDRAVLNSADLKLLHDFEGLERAELRRPWADAPDGYWNPSSPSINQQLSSGPADTDSLLSASSHSSVFETDKPISLDTVAARLEETAGSTTMHLEQRLPMLCPCLRKYADVLCKLQTIKKRQCPIQVDTLLTCANLVLNITENQLKCTQCLYDSCVAMQLVMIFRVILTWSQGQCHPPSTPGPDFRMALGQHEMTEEECGFVKTALMCKALDRTNAQLKLIMSRIEHVALMNPQGNQSWDHEGAEFWNLQQLVSSLIQRFDVLTKRLATEQSRSWPATEG